MFPSLVGSSVEPSISLRAFIIAIFRPFVAS